MKIPHAHAGNVRVNPIPIAINNVLLYCTFPAEMILEGASNRKPVYDVIVALCFAPVLLYALLLVNYCFPYCFWQFTSSLPFRLFAHSTKENIAESFMCWFLC
jgi:hypothetical protein